MPYRTRKEAGMKSQLCYGAFGLLLLMTAIATYLWATYASLLQDETAYIYRLETTEMFEIKMTHSVSPIHFWNFLNPFAAARRRVPEVGAYLGHLSGLRDSIRRHNLNPGTYQFEPDAPTSLISLDHFRIDDQGLNENSIPSEWQDLVTRDNEKDDVILANAVIIKQDWPIGLLGNAVWPVEVTLAGNVVIFFGRPANELCVKEVTRGFPKLEGTVRQVGCFFP
jgi:hypothetical protein